MRGLRRGVAPDPRSGSRASRARVCTRSAKYDFGSTVFDSTSVFMRNSLGWLGTMLAQSTLNYIQLPITCLSSSTRAFRHKCCMLAPGDTSRSASHTSGRDVSLSSSTRASRHRSGVRLCHGITNATVSAGCAASEDPRLRPVFKSSIGCKRGEIQICVFEIMV